MDWTKIKELIQKSKRFALTAHVNPEGDALGAEFALYHHLKSLGKEVHIINNDPTLPIYRFLDPDGVVQVYSEKKHQKLLDSVDVIFILDVSSWDYMGRIAEAVQKSPAVKVCIDHHVRRGKFADIDIINQKACAAGEVVYDLLKELNGTMDVPTATALYASILTDTGVFRFGNTSPKSHLIAAELLKVGINHDQIYDALFENNSWSKVKLLEICLSDIHSEAGGKIAWILVTEEMLKKSRAGWSDAEGLIDVVRTIAGVAVSIIFREAEGGKVKVHLRSKGSIDVQQLAVKHGGGGHRMAAGMTLPGPTSRVVPLILANAKKLIN